MLSKLGVNGREHEKSFDIKICGWKNFRRLVDSDIFEFRPDMKERLELGFSILNSHWNIPFRNKERIIDLLSSSQATLTIKQVSRLLKIGESGTKKHLRELTKLHEISCMRGSGSIPNRWFCSDPIQ